MTFIEKHRAKLIFGVILAAAVLGASFASQQLSAMLHFCAGSF